MTVKNWRKHLAFEKTIFITPDGEHYNLTDFGRHHVVQQEGWGLPNPTISTTSGPFQHGVNPTTIREDPRRITMTHLVSGADRDNLWQNRSDLVNALRLNRTDLNNPTPGSIRRYLSNGQIRQVDVMLVRGPVFDDNSRWDQFSFSESLEFIAHNPIIYDPTQQSDSTSDLACTIQNQLIFPISFGGAGIIFGGSVCFAVASFDINYVGNWEEYPYIVITGPGSNVLIEHVQTGKKIQLNYTIAAGEVVTFDLRYGVKLVTNNFGDPLLGFVSTDFSDLATFAIQPDPIVTGGVNTIQVTVNDGTGDTSVALQYLNRYIGI